MGKLLKVFLTVPLLTTMYGSILGQTKSSLPKLEFESKIISLNSKNLSYKGDTVFVSFNFKNTNYSSKEKLKILHVKPSCNCTGFKVTNSSAKGFEGTIILITTLKSLEKLGSIDAVVKSNAINNFELIKFVPQ